MARMPSHQAVGFGASPHGHVFRDFPPGRRPCRRSPRPRPRRQHLRHLLVLRWHHLTNSPAASTRASPAWGCTMPESSTLRTSSSHTLTRSPTTCSTKCHKASGYIHSDTVFRPPPSPRSPSTCSAVRFTAEKLSQRLVLGVDPWRSTDPVLKAASFVLQEISRCFRANEEHVLVNNVKPLAS